MRAEEDRDGRTKEETAEDWFKETYCEVKLEHPYAHRLDRDTSGVLVFAKNEKAHDFLRKAFTDREVKKEYLAIVHGVPSERKGVIDFDIGRSRKDFRMRSAQPKAKGRLREAVTRYEVIGTAEEGSGKYTLLRVRPKTGRTHQIRVHCAAIQHPIVCDQLYAPQRPPMLGFKRLALHALSITILHPSGKEMTFVAPLPPDFIAAEAQLRGE